ncbi:MAG: TrmB family transcriptional regulator [Haloferacaceae archaeon]
MNERSTHDRAVALLQELGLKEYEARCFVALARIPQGTAKEISEISDVPRTRVYDAVRVLESKGLVEVQHANPQQFRAVAVDEAVATLRREYESRAETLREALQAVEPVDREGAVDATHEVWGLTGRASITTRAQQLVDGADREVLPVVGDATTLTGDLVDGLRQAEERGVTVIVGAVSEDVRTAIASELPEAEVFVSGLEWLGTAPTDGDETAVGRLMLVDRNAILASAVQSRDGEATEHAVFGRGFANGLVTIVRRLLVTGLLPQEGTEAGGS